MDMLFSGLSCLRRLLPLRLYIVQHSPQICKQPTPNDSQPYEFISNFFFLRGRFWKWISIARLPGVQGGWAIAFVTISRWNCTKFFSKLGTNGRQKEREKKNTHSKMGGGGYPAAFYGPDVSGLSIPSAWAMDIFYGSDVNSRTAPSTFTIEPRKGNG